MTDKHYELIGWIGFILIVGAYLLLTLKYVAVNSLGYHFMNLFGALCMAANAKYKAAKPLFWLNLVWSFIAIIGLWQATMD